MTSPEPVTKILNAAASGDAAAMDRLLTILYQELRQIAAARLAGMSPGQTLRPTDLVHEAYLKLVNSDDRTWDNRRHFVNSAGVAMRSVIVDRARAKATAKRGGDREREPLHEELPVFDRDPVQVLALDEALTALSSVDHRAAQVVSFRLFLGLAESEIANVLGVTDRTVQREEVEGVLVDPTTIEATEIDDEDRFDRSDSSFASLDGYVSEFVDADQFEVQGIPVDGSNAVFFPADLANFRDGVLVSVDGRFEAGVLIATRVERRGNNARICAEIQSMADVDVDGGRFELLGVPVEVLSSTVFNDRDGDAFQLADLQPGDFLEVRGFEGSPGVLVAQRIDREDEVDDVELRGRVEAIDSGASTLQIFGVVIPFGSSTEFEDATDQPISRSQFLSQVGVGDIVEARDDEDSDSASFDFADQLEIELED